jgi:hypothetical protein
MNPDREIDLTEASEKPTKAGDDTTIVWDEHEETRVWSALLYIPIRTAAAGSIGVPARKSSVGGGWDLPPLHRLEFRLRYVDALIRNEPGKPVIGLLRDLRPRPIFRPWLGTLDLRSGASLVLHSRFCVRRRVACASTAPGGRCRRSSHSSAPPRTRWLSWPALRHNSRRRSAHGLARSRRISPCASCGRSTRTPKATRPLSLSMPVAPSGRMERSERCFLRLSNSRHSALPAAICVGCLSRGGESTRNPKRHAFEDFRTRFARMATATVYRYFI